ncbi:shootin-1 [Caerostris darwini]|uniref:Shootin-1 n=1 Tax=Caerostris darwini TaxID=1538125 RepID=A0AAV4SZI6_9ARAC|nr:shootin-1 [Caerostris darwini]
MPISSHCHLQIFLFTSFAVLAQGQFFLNKESNDLLKKGVVCLLTYISHTLGEIMEKKPFKKSSFKEQECSYREQYNILDEKYSKIKDILKQVLKELKEIKIEKQHLTEEYEKLATEVKEKDALLERMQSVSEAVIDEYNALKLKCDLEAEAATNAIKRATKYFKENQKLKRNTLHENQSSDMPEESDEILCQEYGVDENISELDVLNKLSSELRTEISNLKVQLDKEIEKQNSLKEDFEIAKILYEQEMKDHNSTRQKLESLELLVNNSRDEAKFENQPKNLKDKSAEIFYPEVSDHTEKYNNVVVKLELAEEQVSNYKHQNNILLSKVQELECQIQKLNNEVSASDLLPIPPPPPPPPLPPPSFNPIKSLITFIHAGKKSAKTLKKEIAENPQQKAMSEMMDAIKKGNIQLKPTPKATSLTPKKGEETALSEMKNILGTLKKKNKSHLDMKHDDGMKNSEMSSSPERDSPEHSSQEKSENFDVNSDVDDELKKLLRKQSIKISSNDVTDNATVNSGIPVHESVSSNENELVECAISENRRSSSENETVII